MCKIITRHFIDKIHHNIIQLCIDTTSESDVCFSFSFICIFQIGLKNMEGVEKEPLTLEKAKMILKDAFISAAERDIYTGDSMNLSIITKDGVQTETYDLRKD